MSQRSRLAGFILLLSLIFPFTSLRAEEVDDFILPVMGTVGDSSQGVNELVNSRLNEIRAALNFFMPGFKCNRKNLTDGLLYALDQNFTEIGRALKSERAVKYSVDSALSKIGFFGKKEKSQSLYRNTGVLGCCIRRININGVMIGIDKIDHFFGNGGILWEESQIGKLTDEQVLKNDIAQEHAGWGLAGSGVKSYGDLTANYRGFHFWQELVDGPNPYFSCQGDEVMLNRKFDIRDFVDEAWDESINCSAYVNEAMAKTVRDNLTANGQSCPRDRAACEKITQKYTAISPQVAAALISPRCQFPNKEISAVEKSASLAESFGFGELKKFFGIRQGKLPVESTPVPKPESAGALK